MIQRRVIPQSAFAYHFEPYANDTVVYRWQLMNADCVFGTMWNLHKPLLLRRLHNMISQQAHAIGFAQAFNEDAVFDLFHYTEHNQMTKEGFRIILKATPKNDTLYWYEYDTVDIPELT